MCDVLPDWKPLTEENGVGPMSPSFHQQNKHCDRLWGSRHVERLCHRQDQRLLADLWVIHLLLVPTETPLPHPPSRYRLGRQRIKEYDQPATESHPLESPLPANPSYSPPLLRQRGRLCDIGLVWFGFSTLNLCLCFLPVSVLARQKQVSW